MEGKARAKVPTGAFSNNVGNADCRRFLYSVVSRRDEFELPLSGNHVPGSNLELDAFLSWSGLDWNQLVDQSAPFWPWEDGAARASRKVINQVGKNDCRRFLDSIFSLNQQLKLPFTGRAITKGHNPELDAFLVWSGVSWDQLKYQSAQWKNFGRVLRPFDPKKFRNLLLRLDLETLVQAAWDRMLLSVPCKEEIGGPTHIAAVTWLRGRRTLNKLLEKHLARLGECFHMCLTDDPRKVDDAELQYAESHNNFCAEFIRDPDVTKFFSVIFLEHIYKDDEFGLEVARGSLPAYLDDCIFKEFNERVFNLDRPDVLTDLIQPVSEGRSGRVVAYCAGWLLHRAFKRFKFQDAVPTLETLTSRRVNLLKLLLHTLLTEKVLVQMLSSLGGNNNGTLCLLQDRNLLVKRNPLQRRHFHGVLGTGR